MRKTIILNKNKLFNLYITPPSPSHKDSKRKINFFIVGFEFFIYFFSSSRFAITFYSYLQPFTVYRHVLNPAVPPSCVRTSFSDWWTLSNHVQCSFSFSQYVTCQFLLNAIYFVMCVCVFFCLFFLFFLSISWYYWAIHKTASW